MAARPEVTHDDGLMPIGEFARRSRLPASTLRYYHQLGLLVPARLDRSSGYRYYSPDQLPAAALVGELRRLGVRPAAIGAVTSGGTDLAAALRRERDRIELEIDARRHALARLDELLAGLATPAPYPVAVRVCRPWSVDALPGAVHTETAAADIRRLMARLRRLLRERGRPDPARYGAVFPLDLASDPVPVTVFGAGPGRATVPGLRHELPAGRRAFVEHRGDLTLGPAYAAVLDAISGAGHHPVGPVVEEYHGTTGSPRTVVSVGVAD